MWYDHRGARPSRVAPAGVARWLVCLILVATGCTRYVTIDPDPFTPFKSENVALTQLPEAEGALKFIVLGDWGRRGNAIQRAVAERMGEVAERVDADFVLTTGDNFYDNGVRSVRDAHWQDSFEEVYTHPALQVPWYPVLGNHDYRGNIRAQIEYSERSDRWRLPAPYHTFVEAIDDTTSVRFVILDTIPIDRLRYRTIAGEGSRHRSEADRQLDWLDSTLAASTSQWNIVVGHHPIYSAGDHGDAESLGQVLEPILEERGVQVYVAGHDHNLQHLETESIDHFVTGAGSDLRRTLAHPLKVFGTSRPGFMLVAVAPLQMLVQFIDADGNILHGDVIELHDPGRSSPVPAAALAR